MPETGLLGIHITDGHVNNVHALQAQPLQMGFDLRTPLGLVLWVDFLFGLDLRYPY